MIVVVDKNGNIKMKVTSVVVSAASSSPTSAQFTSVVQQVSVLSVRVDGNSAQMTSADNALSNAISVVSAAVTLKNDKVTLQNAGSNFVSNPTVINFRGTGVSSHLSAGVAIVDITAGGGGGSVTSAEYVSLVDRVSANSAQMTSADNAISNAVSVVSAAQAVTSADLTSVKGVISVLSQAVSVISAAVSVLSARVDANSAQMTSADNAISNAVSIVSAAQAATSAAVTSVNQVVSVISQQVSVLSARTDQISLENHYSRYRPPYSMIYSFSTNTNTGADPGGAFFRFNSATLASITEMAISRDDYLGHDMTLLKTINDSISSGNRGVLYFVVQNSPSTWIKAVITGALVDNTTWYVIPVSIEASSSGVVFDDSTTIVLTYYAVDANVSAIFQQVSVLSSRVASNSAQMVSADNAISNSVSVVSAAQAVTSAAVTSVNNRVSSVSADLTSFKQSLNNIGDVSVPTPGDGQVLTFNSVAQQWLATSVAAGSGSVTSAEYISLVDRVSANSAQMTSADNAISNAVSIVSAAQAVTSAAVTSVNNRASSISADLTSFKQSINNFGDVSTSSPASAQVLRYVSATGQWVNQTITGGSGSVTSAAYTSLVNRVSANSAQMTSADNAISNAVSVVSAAQAATSAAVTSVNQAISVISNQVSVLSSRVANNSVAVTEISNALSTVRGRPPLLMWYQYSDNTTIADPGAKTFRFNNATIGSATEMAISYEDVNGINLINWILSFDNTISSGVRGCFYISKLSDVTVFVKLNITSAITDNTTWANFSISVETTSGSFTASDDVYIEYIPADANISALSDVVVSNSAQMTSADNAISNAVSIVSAAQAVTSAAVTSVNNRVSANSAQMTSADNAISNAVSIVSAAQAVTSAAVTSVNNRVSSVSADLTSFKQSINNFGDVSTSSPVSAQVLRYVSATGQWVNQTITGGSGSVTSAEYVSLVDRVSANSAQMVSADNAISNAVSIVSAAQAVTSAALTSVQSVVSALQYPAVESVVSAVYSVVEGDRGKIKYFNNTASIEVVLPDGLTSGFQAIIYRGVSAGPIRFSATTSVEAQGSALNDNRTAATIIHRGSNLWIALGAFLPAELGDLSQRVSVLSNTVSAISARMDTLSNNISVLSQSVSVLSQAVSVLSVAVAAVSPPTRVVLAGNASVVAATLTNVSGLSVAVSAGGIYQFQGYMVVNRPNASNGTGYGFTFPAMAMARGTVTTNVLSGLVSIWTFDGDSASNSTIASVGSVAQLSVVVRMDGIFHASANGVIQMQAKTSAAASAPLVFVAGSYMQVIRIN